MTSFEIPDTALEGIKDQVVVITGEPTSTKPVVQAH